MLLGDGQLPHERRDFITPFQHDRVMCCFSLAIARRLTLIVVFFRDAMQGRDPRPFLAFLPCRLVTEVFSKNRASLFVVLS
jgi:hypothetical protein